MCCPDGSASTASPGRITPLAIRPANPRKFAVRTNHRLHRESQNIRPVTIAERHGFQMLQQGRPEIPRRFLAARNKVVAFQRAYRHALHKRNPQVMRARRRKVLFQLTKHAFLIFNKVHLVNCREYVRYSQQRSDIGVTARLRQQALRSVDQNDRQIGGRRAGGHIPRVLLVARRVRNDEFRLRGV